jgi:hypothetical protein
MDYALTSADQHSAWTLPKEHFGSGLSKQNGGQYPSVKPMSRTWEDSLPAQRIAFERTLLERVRALPGIVSAGAIDYPPFMECRSRCTGLLASSRSKRYVTNSLRSHAGLPL